MALPMLCDTAHQQYPEPGTFEDRGVTTDRGRRRIYDLGSLRSAAYAHVSTKQ